MKKTVRNILIAVIALSMIIPVMPTQEVFAVDKTAPVIDTSGITISSKTIGYGETTTISVKITDVSKVSSAILTVHTVGEKYFPLGGTYNETTGKWDFEAKGVYFGLNQIEKIFAVDVFGNETDVYNSKCEAVYSEYSTLNYKDLSKGDFTVSNGSYSVESNKPNVHLDTLTVSNKTPELGDKIKFMVKINDASPIVYTYIDYANSARVLCAGGNYNSDTGYYEYELECTSYGEFQPIILTAEDAFGNITRYVDKSQSYYGKDSGYNIKSATEASLKAANAKVAGSGNDITPPVLDTSSFKIEKVYLKRKEYVVLSFKIIDESAIDERYCNVWYGLNKYGESSTNCRYNTETGRYEVYVGSSYYGTHKIREMELVDVYGNRSFYADSESEVIEHPEYYGNSGKWIETDFTPTTFYVGIENEETLTFASNSTFNGTSKLKVNELSKKNKAYSRLSESGYNIKGFYEVDVEGTCDMSAENTRVCFDAPEGFKDGDKLRIRHLLDDGSIQTENAAVKKGKVCIEVNEFSPFMVEVKKNADKNLFVKGGITYQVIGKSEVKVTGSSKKSIKEAVIPATVKSFGKKYKVTQIDKKAFLGCKKLKKITIGKNVNKIGEKAFYSCKKVKNITINTTKLTEKKVGTKAFKGISKKVKLEFPKSKAEKYKKLLVKKGL